MKSRRWLLAVCLGLTVAFGTYRMSRAQLQTGGGPNFVQQLSAWATNIPQLLLNSFSQTYYGMMWASDTAAGLPAWNIGYGTSITSVTIPTEQQLTGAGQGLPGVSNPILQVDVNGWLSLKSSYFYNNSGSAPTASLCGTSASGTEGSDQSGDISVGTTPGIACIIKFANAPPQKPLCFCNDVTTPAEGCVVGNASTSGFTMEPAIKGGTSADVFQGSDELDWFCSSRQ